MGPIAKLATTPTFPPEYAIGVPLPQPLNKFNPELPGVRGSVVAPLRQIDFGH
jgi:hypothetical protein